MREITLYYAYDDKEFDNQEDCEKYEEKGFNLAHDIAKKLTFFDKDMKEIRASWDSSNVEDYLTWLDEAYNVCVQIERTENLTDEETNFIRENIGCCILNEDFHNEIGLFKFDSWEGWIKVDE